MKFNLKATTNTEFDNYHFQLTDGTPINLRSNPATTIGAHLTYLAVSAGYDANVGKYFGGAEQTKQRYRFGFDCALLSFETFWERNKIGTTLTRFGDFNDKYNHYDFNNISVYSWGADLYYFFNNKKYSQRAAFSYGKIQKRSQGSLYAGLSYCMQDYDFDFNSLPTHMIEQLPAWWKDHKFQIKTHNIGVRLGYGYNWVFAPRWVLGASFSPTLSLSRGLINSETEDIHLSLFLRGKIALVWNSPAYRWFIGINGKINSAVVSDRKTVFLSNVITISTAVGYRFNLW